MNLLTDMLLRIPCETPQKPGRRASSGPRKMPGKRSVLVGLYKEAMQGKGWILVTTLAQKVDKSPQAVHGMLTTTLLKYGHVERRVSPRRKKGTRPLEWHWVEKDCR